MQENSTAQPFPELPRPPVARLLAPVKRFLQIEAASGIVLVICTLVALYLANSAWADWFAGIWKTPIKLEIGTFKLIGDVGHLIINDGLMTLFFFVVGLEVKREIVMGELRDPRKAMLPIVGAIGGVVVPALIYYLLQWGQPGQRGWAIPMATDIAFVVGVLALLGNRVPFGLKIFLLTLAIVDDIIAVIIIAAVFSQAIDWSWLGAGVLALTLIIVMNRMGVRRISVYFVVGVFIWFTFLRAGVHPTVAGVLLGLMTPSSAWIDSQVFSSAIKNTWEYLKDGHEEPSHSKNYLSQVQFVARESISPLHRLESGLHPWVAFVIMPVFALANAGVKLDVTHLIDPIAIAVALGLLIGKPVGIMAACYGAVKLGITRLPDRVSWQFLAGGGCLAGIGFTMALFINSLSFPKASFPDEEVAGKIGVFTGSVLSVMVGTVVLLYAMRRKFVSK